MTEATRIIRCLTEQVRLVLRSVFRNSAVLQILDMLGAGAESVPLSWTCWVLVGGVRETK